MAFVGIFFTYVLPAYELLNGHFSSKKADNIALYESKKNAVLLMKKKLEAPFQNRTVFERVLNLSVNRESISPDDAEALEIDIHKLFSSNIQTIYSEIKEIIQAWRNTNADLDELLDSIFLGEPERYTIVIEAIENEINDDCSLSSVLDDLVIIPAEYNPEFQRPYYAYRELESEFDELAEQYKAAAKYLMDEMIEEIVAVY